MTEEFRQSNKDTLADERIIPEALNPHINHTLDELEGKIGVNTTAAFRRYAEANNLDSKDMFEKFITRYLVGGESLNSIHASSQMAISPPTFIKVLKILGVPLLTRTEVARRSIAKLRDDPEVEARRIEAARERIKDPEIKERQRQGIIRAFEDPGVRARHAAGIARNWQDPEYRQRRAEAMRKVYEDTAYRTRHADSVRQFFKEHPEFIERRAQSIRKAYENPEVRRRQREGAQRNSQDPDYKTRLSIGIRRAYQDPEFRRRHAEGVERLWLDEEYRKTHAQRTRKTRFNPDNVGKWALPTIQGIRLDVGYAQSTWEANFARILRYCGRQFTMRKPFTLAIPEEYSDLFYEDSTGFNLDFVVLDPRGNLVGYEIMAHPKESPKGWIKTEMFIKQYPDIPLHLITPRLYYRLRRHFERRINSDPNLIGWETQKDNLRTNPEKYNPS